jgi:2-oxoisovalerate dehydrogenase E1 component beta subunit
MAVMTVIQAIQVALAEEMDRDATVLVMGQDVGLRGGVFRASDGLIERFGSDRVVDTPLAESAIIGAAIGLSVAGFRPVAEIQFADFIWSAADQIISEAARMRYRSRGAWHCPLVIRTPYGAGVHGGLYHSQSIEATFAHVPGLKVIAPATPRDAKGMLKAAIRDPDPVLVLEHKRTYRAIKGEVPDGDYIVPLGLADVKRSGTTLTVLTYGLMLHRSLEAAEQLVEEGIEVEVIDLRSMRPLDRPTIVESARKTGRVAIVHEDNLTGGFGGELAAIIAAEAFEYLDAPVIRIAAPDVPAMPFAATLEDFCLPSVERIETELRRLAAY